MVRSPWTFVYPEGYSGSVLVYISQQPSSPWQQCRISNATFSIPFANDASITVSCTSFSYVTNAADNTLSAYSVDPTTGALAVIGTPIAAGVSLTQLPASSSIPSTMSTDIYRRNEGSNDVSAFIVDNTTGALIAAPGSPFPAGKDPKAMAIMGYADGYNLYVANAGSDTVSAYSIDLNTGALAGFSTIATGKGPTSIVIDANLPYAFVATTGVERHFGLLCRPEDRRPDPSARIAFPAGGNPLYLALVYGGKFLYSANPDATNPSISGFSVNPGHRSVVAAQRLALPAAGKPWHRHGSKRRLPVCHVGRERCWLSHRCEYWRAYCRCRGSRLPPARMPIQ